MAINLDRVSFNQDHGCFAIGTDEGFAIYNADPLRELVRRNLDGGISLVAMLHRSNIICLVGGGKDPLDSPNKVLIWDDLEEVIVAEIEFRMNIVALKMRSGRLVAATEMAVYVYDFPGPDGEPILLEEIPTVDNPKGILSLSSTPLSTSSGVTMATLGRDNAGNVRFANLDVSTGKTVIGRGSDLKELRAHQMPISSLILSVDGSLLVTASERGTCLKVFNTITHEVLQEFKLGYLWGSSIPCVGISLNGSYICAVSERTIRVFDRQNPSVDIMFNPPRPCVCAFALTDGKHRLLDECYIYSVCQNCTFFRYAFNPSKGKASPDQRLFGRLLKPDDSKMFRLMDEANDNVSEEENALSDIDPG